jgi:hypothetical protein
MRTYLADYNLIAVSANAKETAINTEQTLDTSLLVAKSDIIGLDPRTEDNKDELTGKEEADTIYDLGNFSSATLNFDKAQTQHFAFLLSYGLGVDTPSAYGTGYKHLITPQLLMDMPSFTAGQRFGSTVLKRRFASLFVDQVTATFAKDSWAKVVGTLKGTGKFTDNIVTETITAAYNATTLTLAANGVQGADAPTRLDNVQSIRVLVPSTGEYAEVVYSAVSGVTPAVITMTAPGAVATSTTYEVTYIATEAAWCTFPARVTEPPLRVTDLVVTFGGKWNGTSFLGGHTIGQEIESIEYTLNNNMAVEARVGGTGTYANYALRGGRVQAIKLNRQMRDAILQMRRASGEYFGVRAKATGSLFETGKNYYVDFVWPRCAVLKAAISVNNKILAEAGDLVVLQDDTYGSVRVECANKVAAYAA